MHTFILVYVVGKLTLNMVFQAANMRDAVERVGAFVPLRAQVVDIREVVRRGS